MRINLILEGNSCGIMEMSQPTDSKEFPMPIIPHLSQTMHTVLTTTTETIATALAYVKRPDRAKWTPSTLVQTLVYGWLAHPTATVEQLAGHPLGDGRPGGCGCLAPSH